MTDQGDASRTLWVAHVIVGLKASGAETALLRLVQRSPSRIRHVVISLTDRGDLGDAFEAAGARVITLGLGRGMAGLIALWRLPGRVSSLRPDILQGWMVHGNILAWALRQFRFRRARLAWNLRLTAADAVYEKRTTQLATKAAAALSRSVDLLISNSHAGLRDHEQLGYRARSSDVIPNGFDLSVFGPHSADRARLRGDWRVTDNSVVFALVGRFHQQKGQDTFIAAASRLLEAAPDAIFLLVGRDADQANPALTAAIGGGGVSSRFLLLGARRDIPAIMSAVDVLCMPSRYEGFPNVLGEAMASELPCIATDVSDVARILGPAGEVIKADDSLALAAAMQKMIDIGVAGRLDLGKRARERVAGAYSIEAVTDRYWLAYGALAD